MKKNKIPQIKKDISAFLTSEEGRINKKSVSKIAMGLMVLGMGLAGVMKPDPTSAACSHASHGSHASHSSHSSHGSHGSHSSHASHASHGSHGSHSSHASHSSY